MDPLAPSAARLRASASIRGATPYALAFALLACHRKQEAAPPATSAAQPVTPPVVHETSAVAPLPVKNIDGLHEAVRPPPKEPRPPAPPCLRLPGTDLQTLPDLKSGDAAPDVSLLLDESSRQYEAGHYDAALECAREASRIDPASVAAHHFRAAAFAELGQLDEARTAFARALALDPDDPETLRSVADLYVRRMGGRDDLELALDYVHRAIPRAQKTKDKELQKELYLLQSMALDDLGKPAQALASATRAAELDPKDREARREKGVALFELSRFDQSRVELAKLAAEEPDAWAEQYLGLIAERAHDDAGSRAHFAKAAQLEPDAFRSLAGVTREQFDAVVKAEIEKLPAGVREGLSQSEFSVEDFPDISDLIATDPPLSPGILGLFRPPPETAPDDAKPAILIFRQNLARAVRSDEELHREVRDTLLHEVGHLNGEDDEQLRDRGL